MVCILLWYTDLVLRVTDGIIASTTTVCYSTAMLLLLLQAAAAVGVFCTACRESIISTTLLKLNTYVQHNVKKNDKKTDNNLK